MSAGASTRSKLTFQHVPVKEATYCGKRRHPAAGRSHSTAVISRQQFYRFSGLLDKIELTALICEEREKRVVHVFLLLKH